MRKRRPAKNPMLLNESELAGISPLEQQRKGLENIQKQGDAIMAYISGAAIVREQPERGGKMAQSYINAGADFQSYKHLRKRDIYKIQQLDEDRRVDQQNEEFLQKKSEISKALAIKTDKNRIKRARRRLNAKAGSLAETTPCSIGCSLPPPPSTKEQ